MKRVYLYSFIFGLFLASITSFAQASQFAADWDEQSVEELHEEEYWKDHHSDEYWFEDMISVWDEMAKPYSASYSSNAKSRRGCYQITCKVWADVDKTTQTLHLYVDGMYVTSWPVSTGRSLDTPNMETHPNGRIYRAYTSKKHPGGDYKGLGNMPYAVFIRGGIAIHGTPQGNWRRLGRPASHGCIRLHPENAYTFMNLVKSVGVRQVWVSIRGVTPR